MGGKHKKTVDRLADTQNTVTLREIQKKLAQERAKQDRDKK